MRVRYIKSSILVLMAGLIVGSGYGHVRAYELSSRGTERLKRQLCEDLFVTDIRQHTICGSAVDMTYERLMD